MTFSIPLTVAQRARRAATTQEEHAALDRLVQRQGRRSDVLFAALLLMRAGERGRALEALHQLPEDMRECARRLVSRLILIEDAVDATGSAHLGIWSATFPEECAGNVRRALEAIAVLLAQISVLKDRARAEIVEAA